MGECNRALAGITFFKAIIRRVGKTALRMWAKKIGKRKYRYAQLSEQ